MVQYENEPEGKCKHNLSPIEQHGKREQKSVCFSIHCIFGVGECL